MIAARSKPMRAQRRWLGSTSMPYGDFSFCIVSRMPSVVSVGSPAIAIHATPCSGP